MGVTSQITFGSMLLIFCLIIQVGLVALSVPLLAHTATIVEARMPKLKQAAMLSVTLTGILLGHTLQIWIWALVIVSLGALPEMSTALYYSLVTYTTVGYGDVTLTEPFRIFGTFASITGLLAFGISTAFLVGVVVRILPATFDRE